MSILLTAEDLRMEFGPITAVRDVSFELASGQLLGLIGPNGAGKTTLLRVLAGLQAPTRGAAFIMGRPVLGEFEVVRHQVGFAPDAPPAYEELTVYQFLRFIAAAYHLDQQEADERIDFWLEQLWLTEKRDTLAKELSRGMRQRVTLARTFLPRPHVLLLDEPLAGLDPAGRIQLRNVLTTLSAQGCAMIVSSHILTDLEEVSTHIAIIERGRILQWDTPEGLHHRSDRRRTYRLATLDKRPDDGQIIAAVVGVSQLTCNGRNYTFDYEADEAAAAALLKRFVDQGIRVVSFLPVKASLEDAYLRSGVKQVD